MGFTTIARPFEHEEIIKNSRFITRLTPLQSVDDVEEVLAVCRAAHPDANHHCYAYRFDEVMRFSDDGEPGGTAGRPMLEVLMKRDVQHVLAIVTRYFGGVKLGAGGLVRAYSGSLAKTLDSAPLKEVKDRATLQVSVPFAFMDTLHRLADDWTDLKKHEPEYTASGLKLMLSINSNDVNAFDEAVRNATQAQAQVTVLSNDAA